ncbi:MAG: Crp/Fnr family transcriptional regulator [Proteobacteria bacterium]|nr:MAG: Crp/Fnr family transcriptional regulator [Pseudomonadota bacterium]
MSSIALRSGKKAAVACNNCSLNELCLPRGLTAEELARLEEAIEKTVKITKKNYLYRRDDQHFAIYAVKSGAIKISLSTSDGEEQILGFYLPGDLVGFDALAHGRYSCDAQALEDTLVCELKMDAFQGLCASLPSMLNGMMRQVGIEIEREQYLLLTLGQMRTEERLATFLLGISERNQQRGFSRKEFYLPMPRHDLANYLGMAVETLSRMFSRLQEENMISVRHRLIEILDMDGLRSLAHHTCQTEANNYSHMARS